MVVLLERVPYVAAAPDATSFVEGLEDVELDAVIGCDSGWRIGIAPTAPGLFVSTSIGLEGATLNEGPEGSWGSCTRWSSPFSCTVGVWTEPATLERRELSFVIVTVGLADLLSERVWGKFMLVSFPPDMSGTRGYPAMLKEP